MTGAMIKTGIVMMTGAMIKTGIVTIVSDTNLVDRWRLSLPPLMKCPMQAPMRAL
jgi:hypothetical protein